MQRHGQPGFPAAPTEKANNLAARGGVRLASMAVAALMLAVALAGCAKEGKPEPAEPGFEGLEGVATANTGLVRGIVVDDAIRPLEGASIEIEGGPTVKSNERGAFLIDKLAPGAHFLSVSLPGYATARQGFTVEAGVADPTPLRILLAAQQGARSYVQDFQFNGFIECSVTAVAVGFAACSGVGNDKFTTTHELDGVPTFVQSEVVWRSTQALGAELSVMYSWDGGCDPFLCDHANSGTSPLLLAANQTIIDEMKVGSENDLMIRVFNSGLTVTDEGVPGGGVGFTFQQEFTVYTHVFYNMEPREGWRFTADGDP
jgi:hypothetical protein